MVDPNRKINRLTDKDIEFLDECEEEFSCRFTDQDEEFVKHCSQGFADPPVVPNWGEHKLFNRNSHSNRADYRGNRRWNNNHRQGGYQPYGDFRGHRNHNQNHNSRGRWKDSS